MLAHIFYNSPISSSIQEYDMIWHDMWLNHRVTEVTQQTRYTSTRSPDYNEVKTHLQYAAMLCFQEGTWPSAAWDMTISCGTDTLMWEQTFSNELCTFVKLNKSWIKFRATHTLTNSTRIYTEGKRYWWISWLMVQLILSSSDMLNTITSHSHSHYFTFNSHTQWFFSRLVHTYF